MLGKSARTIRWQISKGAAGWFPGAYRDGERAWRIPKAELDGRTRLGTPIATVILATRIVETYAADPSQLDPAVADALVVLRVRLDHLARALEAHPGAAWSAGHAPE